MILEVFEGITEKTKNGRPKPFYVVYTNDNEKAVQEVKRKRRLKETYVVRDGYVNRRGELFLEPVRGISKVKVVTVEE